MEGLKKILVVDDEESLANVTTTLLESSGFHVEKAFTVEDAIAKLDDHEFHIIVSDVRMPNGGGMRLLEEAMKLNQSPKFMFMTGFSDVTEEEAKDAGALALMKKPLDYKKLLSLIRELSA